MSTHKREIQGVVVKKAGDKTASVLVTRQVLHPKYHKTVKRFKKYLILLYLFLSIITYGVFFFNSELIKTDYHILALLFLVPYFSDFRF